ncbi:MAG TPA: MotA/TolQ/ExbB proton channel family protein [Polyangia bacterium]|nr:MotA/TolQ/ExbB proton channel family protein [Polyangia bacterium]
MFLEAIKRTAAQDWWLLALLGLWSVAGLTVILERIHFLWNIQERSEDFKNRILASVEKGELAAAAALCEASTVPLAQVFERGFEVVKTNSANLAEAVALRRTAVVQEFKRYLWLLGTIGSTAVFVGLFGTIIGIMAAFHSMSIAGTGGFKVVAAGISSALIATAIGLAIALLALMAYNYFTARINQLALAYKVMTEEFVLSLSGVVGRTSRGVA